MKKITFAALAVPLMWVLLLLLFFKSNKLHAQETMVLSGVVKSADGSPMQGVTVWQKDTDNGTQTNEQGFYTLSISPNAEILFEYIGFKTHTVRAKGKVLNVTLTADDDMLDEVVINAGYYSVKDKERTGSISKITSKEIGQQPVANPLAAMQGRMAGVNITQSSGTPGGGFDIQIRGRNSLRTEGNAPLYIVDGVPFLSESKSNQNLSSGLFTSTSNNPLQLINPNDIESIEVLKDADATAIYGSRGANGVVLITTKKGLEQPTVFSLQSHTTVGVVPKFMNLLNTEQYLRMRSTAFHNDGIAEFPANAYDVNGTWNSERYTDWQKELIGGKAVSQHVSAGVRGGDKRNSFMIQASVARDGTVFPGDYGNKRKNLLAQFAHSTADDKWKIETQFIRGESNNNLLGKDLTQLALTLAPNAPVLYNADGSLNWENSTWDNPLSWKNQTYTSKNVQWLTSWTVQGKLASWAMLKVLAGYNESRNEERKLVPHTFYSPAWGMTSAASSSMLNEGAESNWNIEPQLHFNKSWNKHSFYALVGTTFLKQQGKQSMWYASNFTSNSQLTNLAAAKVLQLTGNVQNQYAYNAVFARANYQYDGRLILNVTGRRDGSSRFGPDKRWGNFGAVGAAWIFSREKFFDEISWLSFGKVRTSYGTTGSDRIGDYQYLDMYGNSGGMYDMGGLYPLRLFNPDFGWETNLKKEIAIELSMFNNRLNFSSSYYHNTSSDQLVGIPLAGTTGFSSVLANLPAEVRNTGWEFEWNAKLITAAQWQWTVFGNISFNRNKLLSFPNLEESTYRYTYAVGHPTAMQYVFEHTGIDSETGRYTFKDFNGDGKITASDDMKLIVDTTPKYFTGFGQNISYRNWSLDMLFQAVKQTGRNYMAGWGMPGIMSNQPHNFEDLSHGQLSAGYDMDAYNNHSIYMQSQAAYSNASYIRLKNLVLNYRISSLNSKGLNGTVYMAGQNLFTWTSYKGLDPESQSNVVVPPLKVWSLGFTLNY